MSDYEESISVLAGGLKTHPTSQDTDQDGIPDGVELGRTSSIELRCAFVTLPDSDPSTRTHPALADSDGDGLKDGEEDLNRNGRVDPGETDPNDPSNGGGVPDGGGSQQDGGTQVPPDAGSPTDAGFPTDAGSPTDAGQLDDPRAPDKDLDCDGVSNGQEYDVVYSGGLKTHPVWEDTDQDGIPDGVELGITAGVDPRCVSVAVDMDPSTTTHPVVADTDGDGLLDGQEDTNHNGRVDPGETDPRDGSDGAPNTPAGHACAPQNLRQVSFTEDTGGDLRLALRPSFQEVQQLLVDGNSRGFIGYDDTHKVAFIAYKRGQVGSSTTAVNDELGVRGQFLPSVTSTTVTTQTFTTWDGHPAVLAHYDQAATTNLRDYANSVATMLVGSGAGVLSGGAGVTGPYKIQAQYVHRSNQSVVVVLAITPSNRFVEPGLFVMGDTAGGSALAQFGDTDALQCETFTANNGMTDFLFVVDDSGSMATSQSALGDAANAVAARLGNSTLDWRISMVTSTYTQSGAANSNVFRGFTTDINQFKAWLQQNPTPPCPDPTQGCWIGTNGSSDEKTLHSARAAVDYMTAVATPADKKLRPGAKLVVILLTDVRDSGDTTPVSTYINYFLGSNPTGQRIPMHGIVCDAAGGECYPGEPVTDPRHVDVIQATGGISGSIRNSTSIQNSINAIMDSAIASSGYRTLKPPIGASVRVAVESVLNPSLCNANDLPRSRVNGFDVDGVNQVLSFYGACRPSVAGSTKAAVSYRAWSDLTPSWAREP